MRLAKCFTLTVSLLTAASATLAGEPLRWQPSGVTPVAHAAASRPQLRPKAPSVPISSSRATQAVATAPVAAKQPAPRVSSNPPASAQGAQAVRRAAYQVASQMPSDTRAAASPGEAITPACYNGSCGPECGCGMPGPLMDPSCGLGGCGDVACGVPCDDSCGCGEIGCGGMCGEGVCGCGCGAGVGNCLSRGAVPVVFFLPPIQNLNFFGGVQAFKGALDANRDRGNFGGNLGVNLSGRMAWLPLPGLGYQLGYRAVSSQLHGSDIGDTADPHTQQFFTAGLFHRQCVGLNYGVVYDLLKDERIESADFGQLRGLISVRNPRGHEIGFLFARHLSDNVLAGQTYEGVDQYLLFYRLSGQQGGEFRFFGGMDDDNMGIVGADVDVPLNNRWSLQSGFSYLIPEDDTAGIGSTQEGWNIGMNLVWHYGKRARQSYGAPFRPLFNVADNGSFFVDDKP
ncbi:DUF6666 family protein [Botrimarina hoheduenensis]|uniref:Carbohydrate-selective porin, OprB family n=1 Tax=Botrimarina hoheduenensis TaxID=2528000 RepID=A0A5C5VVA7_9BACT|nr:DUF6666 family protein [Botrimarina hoheduenensis]TWT42544.1 hypothetical protein Pla111_28490 [Botrimarina hoheduenensis]